MRFQLLVKPEAEADLEEVATWYNRQQEGLGDEFVDAAKEAIRQIRRNPTLFEVVYGSVRAAMLKKFPYVVYFEVEEDQIAVFGVFHGRRDPNVWQARIDEDV